MTHVRMMMLAAVLAATMQAQKMRCAINLPSVLLKNPAGYTESMFGVPTVAVAKGRQYRIDVAFEDDVQSDDLSRLRRVVVFQRISVEDCAQKLCWSEVARFTSRDGAKQTRTIRPEASEIIVVSWHVAQKDTNTTGAASAAGCSAGPRLKTTDSEITLRLPSPYGEQIVKVAPI